MGRGRRTSRQDDLVDLGNFEDQIDDLEFEELRKSGLTDDDIERLVPNSPGHMHIRRQESGLSRFLGAQEKPLVKIESPLAEGNERGCATFTPHAFETTLEDVPTIYISEQAFKDMMIIVGEVKTEVGWLGDVQKLGSDYLINEIFITEQEVSMGTTEMSVEGMAKLCQKLVKREDAEEICNNLKFWGHSHVNMQVEPSGTDDQQMEKFSYNDFFIRGILNKKGEMKFWLYIYEYGLMIEDVPWMIHIEPEEDRADELRKIIDKAATYRHHYFPSFGGMYGRRDDDDDFKLDKSFFAKDRHSDLSNL